MSDWATASGARGPSSLQSRPSCAPAQGRRGRAAADRAARARQLTAALLEADFGVRGWWVPDGHLVPPVTNRANYIHWLEDLLALSSPGARPPLPSTVAAALLTAMTLLSAAALLSKEAWECVDPASRVCARLYIRWPVAVLQAGAGLLTQLTR